MSHSNLTNQGTDAGGDQSSDALHQDAALFRVVFEGSSLGMALLNLSAEVERINPALCRMLGYAQKDLTLLTSAIHADDRVMTTELIGEIAQDIREHFLVELRLTRKGGGVIWARFSANVVRDPSGAPQAIMCQVEDISEQARSQRTIRELAAFAEFNPNPVFEFSPDGGLRYSNRAAIELARSLGKSDPGAMLPPETREVVTQCWITGKSRLRLTTNLSNRTISWSFFPIGAIGRVHCYAGDVTERLALEEQLRQSQRLEAVGQLAAGVAHDFNNILTVIHGHASIFLTDPNLSHQSQECAQQVVDAAERGASLTRQLLVFSRKQVILPVNLNLNSVVNNLTRMLRRLLGEHISLCAELEPDLPSVCADVGMMEQVLMNLAVNARDAMSKGGKLLIRTRVETIVNVSGREGMGARPGRFVRVSVEDNGAGISPEHIGRIFEPFFTTKEAGKGTGLGLATVYGIVRQHHGWVEVTSELGRGTAFHVYLQATEGESDAQPQSPAASSEVQGSEKILVVEDEQPLREMVTNLLTRCGYSVLAADSAHHAIELWAEHKQTVDLLFTDLVMPGTIEGRELASYLKKEKPSLKVIYTSGYALDNALKAQFEKESACFLQKPYHPHHLTRVLRDCLDQNHQA